MSNFEASIVGALIGGGLAVATGILLRIYTDLIEARRLRVALAAEIRAILDLIEHDQLILKLEDLLKHCRATKGVGFLPVQFNSNYDDIFRSAADKLGLLPSQLVERLVTFHYAVQHIIELLQLNQRPLHPDNPFYPGAVEHEAMLEDLTTTRELGRNLINDLEQPRQ